MAIKSLVGSGSGLIGVVLAGMLSAPTVAASPEDAGPLASWPPAAPTVLTVQTAGGVPVVSRDQYVDATLQLDGVTRKVEIRGRGNSTWGWAKKPYKLKLQTPAALVGPRPQEEWVLLANLADRSALRTAAAFAVASRTRLAWTPASRFVDLVLNGESLGLFLLTEQVEQGRGRVELPDGGYLLEINERYSRDGDPGFRSRRGTPVAFKDPDELTRKQRHQVRRAVRTFERVLHGRGFADPTTGYAAHLDVRSVIDWYLVEELFANQDSNFRSSVHVTWTPDGRFAMGPVWDFDLSAGTRWRSSTPPEGWHTRNGRHWVARLLEDPAFVARVQRRWAEIRPFVDQVVAQIPGAAEPLRASAEADWARWHAGQEQVPGSRHADSFTGEVTFLRGFLAERAAWLSSVQAGFGQASSTERERGQVAWVPVRLSHASAHPVSVSYTLAGTATRRTDYSVPDGPVAFAPGQTVRYIPVSITADDVPEGPESVTLALAGAEGVVLSSPRRVTVRIAASDQQPDLAVRRAGSTRFVGDDVVNRSGRGQVIRSRVRAGERAVYVVRVVSDGNASGRIRLTGHVRGAASVRYWHRGEDVTRKLVSTRGWRVRLAPGLHRDVRMVVTAHPGASAGARAQARLRAVWRGDVVLADTVGAVVRVR